MVAYSVHPLQPKKKEKKRKPKTDITVSMQLRENHRPMHSIQWYIFIRGQSLKHDNNGNNRWHTYVIVGTLFTYFTYKNKELDGARSVENFFLRENHSIRRNDIIYIRSFFLTWLFDFSLNDHVTVLHVKLTDLL